MIFFAGIVIQFGDIQGDRDILVETRRDERCTGGFGLTRYIRIPHIRGCGEGDVEFLTYVAVVRYPERICQGGAGICIGRIALECNVNVMALPRVNVTNGIAVNGIITHGDRRHIHSVDLIETRTLGNQNEYVYGGASARVQLSGGALGGIVAHQPSLA